MVLRDIAARRHGHVLSVLLAGPPEAEVLGRPAGGAGGEERGGGLGVDGFLRLVHPALDDILCRRKQMVRRHESRRRNRGVLVYDSCFEKTLHTLGHGWLRAM